jgi:hypothetical protein
MVGKWSVRCGKDDATCVNGMTALHPIPCTLVVAALRAGKLGYLAFGGEDGGGCVLPGKLLIANGPTVALDCDADAATLQETLSRHIEQYMSTADNALIEAATDQPAGSLRTALIAPLLETDGCVLANVLSNERFVFVLCLFTADARSRGDGPLEMVSARQGSHMLLPP